MTTTRGKPQLSHMQRYQVEQARQLAAIPLSDIPDAMDVDPENLALAYGMAFGAARGHVRELLAIIDELTKERQDQWPQSQRRILPRAPRNGGLPPVRSPPMARRCSAHLAPGSWRSMYAGTSSR